jgi:hypothetical protein
MAQLRQPPSSPPVRATQARAAELRKRLDGASGLAPRLTLDDPLPPPVNRQPSQQPRIALALLFRLCWRGSGLKSRTGDSAPATVYSG